MSSDVSRQQSCVSEASTYSDGDSTDDDMDDYYNCNTYDDLDLECTDNTDDPEYFEHETLHIMDAEKLLNEEIERLHTKLKLDPSVAKMILLIHSWDFDKILEGYQRDPSTFMIDSHLASRKKQDPVTSVRGVCSVCCMDYPREMFHCGPCGHVFCRDCWDMHVQVQISHGVTTAIACMAKGCPVLVTEDLVYTVLSQPKARDQYSKFSFTELIKSHPRLRYCPGVDCPIIIKAKEPRAKKVECSVCGTSFCFKCGIAYHAPTECDVIKKWLTKCEDDSETANYISANTKDCPKCHVCIEKNGGCNHMQCPECKFDFCWMCLGDWKAHGSEYYECSRYKENPNIANESEKAQNREKLKKYLFYYERWENHAKSLSLEEKTKDKISARIQEKVMNNQGTWIDWQYLMQAAQLLKKCRYTLQYTYPYAFYMEKDCKKSSSSSSKAGGGSRQLFEYQQSQLEAEVEELSWKVERADLTDRGDLENQMDVAEKRRQTLLKDFLEV